MLQGEESCADSVQQFCLIVERQTHSDAGNTYKCHKMMYAETFNLSLGLTMSTYCLLAFMLFPYFALLIYQLRLTDPLKVCYLLFAIRIIFMFCCMNVNDICMKRGCLFISSLM